VALGLATTRPCSQLFGGTFSAEPEGWFVNGANGRPLKGYGSKFPGSIWHLDFHKGIDQYGPLGADLLALEAGKVVSINKAIGEVVVQIRGQANSRYQINHCNSILVAVGDSVARAQHIAEMGKLGNASGVHSHTMVLFKEKASDGITRWMAYDPALFSPASSYKMGPYSSVGVPDYGVVPGGSMIYDDRIYPIRAITINDGTNVRKLPDPTSDKLTTTTGVTPASQVNEIPGGKYTIAGVDGTLWAKVKLPINGTLSTGYVAKPLIKV
jgi:murein DD-endopeptidase MepM/ murein hydrolase activator NlpD